MLSHQKCNIVKEGKADSQEKLIAVKHHWKNLNIVNNTSEDNTFDDIS